ncbi:MAG: hypothetical protein K6F71_07255 [Ruminococcus sp.]|uniref:hypothetical protein n=1 Tax=Ruminococcus sp. TaxID=41978 RepID=UPI0025E9E4E6|nr:hypothetical protein [Ruminococcus sp.]MCR5540599.1 hypothetical protein [Ruminococcus sp.]
MNNNQNVNKEMSRSFGKFGLVVICLTLAVFLYKTMFGYTKVKMYETYDNCTVTTHSKVIRDSDGDRITKYYVKVVREDPGYVSGAVKETKKETQQKDSRMKVNITYRDDEDEKDSDGTAELFSESVPYEYYKLFRNYKSSRVTMYTTDWGRHYPVSLAGCDKTKAEHEYRKLDPPLFTWMVLGFFGFIGIMSMSLSLKSKSVADNYSGDRVYESHFEFSNTEDALVGMAHARIQREKDEERRRRERRDRNIY